MKRDRRSLPLVALAVIAEAVSARDGTIVAARIGVLRPDELEPLVVELPAE